MAEHLIRLRRGWERLEPEGGAARGWVTLPLSGFPGGVSRLRLARSFQTPPLDPLHETLWLRLDAVPGLVSVALNDREIARGPFPSSPLLLPLVGNLVARNRLILEVEPPPFGDSPWGDVALVISESEAAGARGPG
jgi:hypothetical protein